MFLLLFFIVVQDIYEFHNLTEVDSNKRKEPSACAIV